MDHPSFGLATLDGSAVRLDRDLSPEMAGVASFLGSVPWLADLPTGLVLRLARHLRLVRHETGTVLAHGDVTGPLRIVVHGAFDLLDAGSPDQMGAWTLGPGFVHGFDAFDAWCDRRPAQAEGRWPERRAFRQRARANVPTWTLELPQAAFDEVFGDVKGQRLLAGFDRIRATMLHLPDVVRALRADERLRWIAPRRLQRLALHARPHVHAEAEQLVSGDLHYVVSGETLVDGHDPRAANVVRAGGTTVPARRIGREVHGLYWRRGGLSLGIPAHAVTELLASRGPRATQIDVVVTLSDDTELQPRVRRGIDRVADQLAEDHGRQAINVSLTEFGDGVSAGLDALLVRHGGHHGHLIIDASAADERDLCRLWHAIARLDRPVRLVAVFDDPARWANLPAVVGPLPCTEVLPVAWLGRDDAPTPGALHASRRPVRRRPAFGRLIDDLLAPTTTPDRAGAALADLLHAGASRAEIHGSASPRTPWPSDAVRLSGHDELDAEACARWARALARRRVGVAIGGGGVQAYVAIPFLRALADAGVPVDALAGTSVGSFLSVFYAAKGDAGLRQIAEEWPTIQAGVLAGFVDVRPLARWLAAATNDVDLADLPIPTVVASTVAATGEPRHHSHGLAAKACMASGSIPPMAPTFIDGERLLDGALVEDLPTGALIAAGVDLVIGVQVLPPIDREPGLPVPPATTAVTQRARSLNPLLRFWDFGRSYVMMGRRSAQRGERHADVVYAASTENSLCGFFWQGPKVLTQASNSEALRRGVRDSIDAWRSLCDASEAPGLATPASRRAQARPA